MMEFRSLHILNRICVAALVASHINFGQLRCMPNLLKEKIKYQDQMIKEIIKARDKLIQQIKTANLVHERTFKL